MIVACLIWYDEPVENLHACVTSLAGVADYLLAVDGPFENYPALTPVSAPEQAATIHEAAAAIGIPVEVVTVRQPWRGDEVAKRAYTLRRGVELAMGGWLLVLDGDETIDQKNPLQLHLELADTITNVAEVELRTLIDDHETRHPARRLFRGLADLTVSGRHSRYVAGDRVLWDGSGEQHEEHARDISGLLAIRHHSNSRSDARQAARSAWYLTRNKLCLEA